MTPIDFVTRESIIRFSVTEPHGCISTNTHTELLNTYLWTNIVYFCFWLIPCSLFAQICKSAADWNWLDEGAPCFPCACWWQPCSWGQKEMWLWYFPRQPLSLCQEPAQALHTVQGIYPGQSVAVHCSQQKGRFLLFLLSSHNHSRLTEGISYRFWKSDEHWWYLSGNFSWSQIFVKLQLPRLKAEPKLAGAWLRNSIYFIWFESM